MLDRIKAWKASHVPLVTALGALAYAAWKLSQEDYHGAGDSFMVAVAALGAWLGWGEMNARPPGAPAGGLEK